MKFCDILGVKFDIVTTKEALDKAIGFINDDKKHIIYTPNPEMVMEARKDSTFMQVLNSSSMNIPDGIGIVYGSKFTDNPIKYRVAGCDLLEDIFNEIKDSGKTVYFFGSAPNVGKMAKHKMEQKYKGLNIVGVANGYFDAEAEAEIIAEINRLKPDLLLVGLGFPKQEKWIFNNIDRLNIGLAIGVGGSLDVLSGSVKRAPKVFIKLNLEWFYRLICQPSRWVRMLQLPLFMLVVIRDRFFSKSIL